MDGAGIGKPGVGPSPAGMRVLSLHGRIHDVSHTWLPNSCSKYHHCPVIWTFFHQSGPDSRRTPPTCNFIYRPPVEIFPSSPTSEGTALPLSDLALYQSGRAAKVAGLQPLFRWVHPLK